MNKSIDSLLKEISENLSYHKLRIRFSPTKNIQINHWIGSILRNNFLFAAEKIQTEKGLSLLNVIDIPAVDEKDPLFDFFSGSFPKGYALTNVTSNNSIPSRTVLQTNEIYTFSICLIGKMDSLHSFFIEAVTKMCKRGIGSERIELRLIDICEIHPIHPPHLLYANGSDIINSLTLPITVHDFTNPDTHNHKMEIDIRFLTPVNLTHNREKKNQNISFQDKLNGFPSMYQIVRSMMYRFSKLAVLYGKTEKESLIKEDFSLLDEWILQATNPILIAANIHRKTVNCIPQLNKEHEIKFRGYTGHISYYGSISELIPFLLFAQDIGIGRNVVYGLGECKISYKII